MSRRFATFSVSEELLRERLNLPANVQFVGAGFDAKTGAVEFTVSSPSFAELKEGQTPPVVTPLYREQSPVLFLGWGS